MKCVYLTLFLCCWLWLLWLWMITWTLLKNLLRHIFVLNWLQVAAIMVNILCIYYCHFGRNSILYFCRCCTYLWSLVSSVYFVVSQSFTLCLPTEVLLMQRFFVGTEIVNNCARLWHFTINAYAMMLNWMHCFPCFYNIIFLLYFFVIYLATTFFEMGMTVMQQTISK